jgi:hypothetical protein
LYSQSTYGIDHIAKKVREGLERDGRINSVFDSENGKYLTLEGRGGGGETILK